MKLTDLWPHWIDLDEHRVAFVFLCPHCRAIWMSCALVPLSHMQQRQAFHHIAAEGGQVIMCRQGAVWTINGEWGFDLLTVVPSLDASAAGHWHGHIANGEMVS
jgi:hypothetical protein